jgi:hypothetical protein
VVLLPASTSEDVRQVGFGTACPGETDGSILLPPTPEVSSAVAKFLLEDALFSPRQCSTPKPLKFYNHKSKARRLSKMDDGLVTKVVSVISASPVVPQFIGSASSP